MAFNTDRSFFQLIVDFGRLGLSSVEVDPGITREQLISLVVKGEYAPREVLCVFEFNPVENFCNDITEDFTAEVERRREARGLQAAE